MNFLNQLLSSSQMFMMGLNQPRDQNNNMFPQMQEMPLQEQKPKQETKDAVEQPEAGQNFNNNNANNAQFQIPSQELMNGIDPKQKQIYFSNMLIQQQQNIINQLIAHNTGDPALFNPQNVNPEVPNTLNNTNNTTNTDIISKEDMDKEEEKKLLRKRIKKQNGCGHDDKEHYAKGMCANCYHRKGRTKKPWKCGHTKLYAKGYCQNCYINRYNQQRRDVPENQQQADDSLDEENIIDNNNNNNNNNINDKSSDSLQQQEQQQQQPQQQQLQNKEDESGSMSQKQD